MSFIKNIKKKYFTKETAIFIIEFCLVFLLAYSIPAFLVQRTFVFGSSMENTYQHGESVLCNKIIYKLENPQRFDVITFRTKNDDIYIKRIIGMPNETIKIEENGSIYINGNLLSEAFGKEIIKDNGLAAKEISLKDDEYFVLGDNRNNSIDSRFESVGNVKSKDIIGRIRSES